MDKDTLTTERANLVRVMTKRQNNAGYAANVAAIKARIAEIDAALAVLDQPES